MISWTREHKDQLLFYLRFAIGFGLLALVIRAVDLGELSSILVKAKLQFLLLALLFVVIYYFLSIYKWAIILWTQSSGISFARLSRFYWMGTFLGSFLPTNMSTDMIKVFFATRYTYDLKGAVSSILVDRIIATFSLALIALISIAALQYSSEIGLGSSISTVVMAVLVLCIMVPIALQNGYVIRWTTRVLGRFQGRVFGKILAMYENFVSYYDQRPLMARLFLLSSFSHIFTIAEFYSISLALSTTVPIGYFFLFIPLVGFLTVLPLGGLGVLEAGIVFFFSQVGMSPSEGLAIALVHRAVLLAANLPGGLLYMFEGSSSKPERTL